MTLPCRLFPEKERASHLLFGLFSILLFLLAIFTQKIHQLHIKHQLQHYGISVDQ